jgi:hypothetical protein
LTTGTTREKRKTEATDVSLNGRPVAKSNSRNQTIGEGDMGSTFYIFENKKIVFETQLK